MLNLLSVPIVPQEGEKGKMETGGERMTEQVQEALEKQLQLLSERSQGDEIMPDELYQLSQAMVLIAGHLAGL